LWLSCRTARTRLPCACVMDPHHEEGKWCCSCSPPTFASELIHPGAMCSVVPVPLRANLFLGGPEPQGVASKGLAVGTTCFLICPELLHQLQPGSKPGVPCGTQCHEQSFPLPLLVLLGGKAKPSRPWFPSLAVCRKKLRKNYIF
jgi:hypothetical protein